MRVDLLYALTNRTGEMSWAEVLQATRRHAGMAEQLGFDSIWLGEHHFDIDGTDACANPVMLAADLAARTKTLRLGMAAVSLTLWHPVRLAEDLALLDHFSDGRLDVAFGRGILPVEVMNLNPAADRWFGGSASNAIFDEHLEIVRRAWTQDPFSWKSAAYTFPYPGIKYEPHAGAPYRPAYADEKGNFAGLGLVPQPVQKPTPPMYAVTESMEGFLGAARKGLGAITWYPTGQVLRELFEAYREQVCRTTGSAPALGERCGVLRLCLVANTDEDARRISESSVAGFFKLIVWVRGLKVWLDVGEDPADPRFSEMPPYDLLMDRDHLMIGSPDTVLKRMERLSRSHGIQHWLLQMGFPGIRNPDLERSLQLFSREVMPAIRRL